MANGPTAAISLPQLSESSVNGASIATAPNRQSTSQSARADGDTTTLRVDEVAPPTPSRCPPNGSGPPMARSSGRSRAALSAGSTSPRTDRPSLTPPRIQPAGIAICALIDADTIKRMWDLFCEVIDNYGDIGVSWRLARMLDAEHGIPVRLWCDDLAAFARIEPRLDPGVAAQRIGGVEVRRWAEPFPPIAPGDAVIEAFGCRLPEAFLDAMAARRPAPVWINLEYLTAEPWAAECHGVASLHPRLPLVKHFFFPGFGPRTGGLLRERDLVAARDAAQREARTGPLRVSVFGYENAAFPRLLDAWARGARPVECLVPEGRALAGVRAFAGVAPAPGARIGRGALEIVALPFTDQAGYDRLLWSCDWNFVRGEDSFARALWAARPLVWHLYPQQAGAHFAKLEAFLDIYAAALEDPARAAVCGLMRAWNGAPHAPAVEEAWEAAATADLRGHAADWAARLAAGPELAATLADFIRSRVK